ncbi:MAG: RrF2 family transcriptional regulator [bacterium]
MRLSTKGEYGMIAMLQLAQRYNEGPISIREICRKHGLSTYYIEQLFIKLRKRGLIASVRGPGGGYRLAKSPSQITAGDVIRVLEGPINLVDCSEGHKAIKCKGFDCVIRKLWDKVEEAMAGILDSTTLQDLCDDAQRAHSPAGEHAAEERGRELEHHYVFYI